MLLWDLPQENHAFKEFKKNIVSVPELFQVPSWASLPPLSTSLLWPAEWGLTPQQTCHHDKGDRIDIRPMCTIQQTSHHIKCDTTSHSTSQQSWHHYMFHITTKVTPQQTWHHSNGNPTTDLTSQPKWQHNIGDTTWPDKGDTRWMKSVSRTLAVCTSLSLAWRFLPATWSQQLQLQLEYYCYTYSYCYSDLSIPANHLNSTLTVTTRPVGDSKELRGFLHQGGWLPCAWLSCAWLRCTWQSCV